jgi:hypothetical protein
MAFSTVQVRFGNPSLSTSECFYFKGMPTPYVTRNQEMVYYGKKSHAVTTIQLNGSIIGTSGNTEIINNLAPGFGQNLNTLSLDLDRKQILSGFARHDYGKLAIYENGTSYKTFENCIVKDISFDPVAYGKQNYSISLTCFEANTFKTMFGVLEPVNNISFSDNEDGTIQITQDVSAKGFSTASAIAIQYAEDFVDQTTGITPSQIAPRFITTGNWTDSQTWDSRNLILKSVSKDVNRVDGSCSASLDYIWQNEKIDDVYITGVTSKVSTNINSGIQSEFLTVDVNYEIKGSYSHDPTTLSNYTPTTGQLYHIASGALGHSTNTRLNQIPLTLSIDDNSFTNKTVKIDASYDNNMFPDYFQQLGYNVFFDYDVDVSTDDIRDTSNVSLNGVFKGRGPNRYDHITGFYENYVIGGDGSINEFLYYRANEFYTGIALNQLYGTKDVWELNHQPENVSIKLNPIEESVDISCSFNNKDFAKPFQSFNPPSGTGYTEFSYKIDVKPRLNQCKAVPSVKNGIYGVYNLNVGSRETLSVSVDARANLHNNAEMSVSQPIFKSQIQAYNYELRTGILGKWGLLGIPDGAGLGGTGYCPLNGNICHSLITDNEGAQLEVWGYDDGPLTKISSSTSYNYSNWTNFVD